MADRNLRMKVILEGLDRLTAPLKSVAAASGGAGRSLKDTNDKLRALQASQAKIATFRALKQQFGETEAAMGEAQRRVASLAREIAATDSPTKKMAAAFERAKREARTLKVEHQQQAEKLQQLRRDLGDAGINTGRLAEHERRLRTEVAATTARLKQQTDQLGKMEAARRNSDKMRDLSGTAATAGLSMIGAGVAAGAPVVGAVKQAMTLESAMADVAKVTNMTRPQIEGLSNDFLDMQDNIPVAAAELAAIAAAAGAAGVGMDKLGRPMADQRAQLKEFTRDAAEMGVAFDMTADIAGETMAKWRAAFQLPQQDIRALGDRVNALTNTFGGKAANISDIVTRIGSLGAVGGLVAHEIAALGSSLDSIGIPSEVAATGIKNTMLALTKGEAATKSQAKAFRALGLDAVNVAKDMQRDAGATILDVFGRLRKLPKEAQAGALTQLFGSESVAAIAPLLTNLDGLKARLDLVGDASNTAGSMHAEFLNRIGTTEGATGLAANALSGLNITMGKALLPTVVKLAGIVGRAASATRKWAGEHPKLAKGLMMFMAAGAGLLILLGGLALGFAALTAAAAPLGIALAPLLLIVAAVAAVAAAAYLIYDNWDGIVAFFSGIWTQLKQAFDGGIVGVIGLLWSFHKMVWNALWEGLKQVAAMLPSAAGFLFGAMKTLFFNSFLALPSLLFQFGVDSIKGLVNGLLSYVPSLQGTVNRIAGMIPESVRSLLGIHSPSRVFAQIGGFVMQGLDQGIGANEGGPIARVKGIAGDLTRALAAGAAVPAIAAAPMAAPAAAATVAGGGGAASYTFNIHAAPGMDAEQLADLVAQKVREIEREKAAGKRSSYDDEGDFGGFV
ncbi:phage tail tape measure protein, TP901 family, core region [Sphingomonas laterariae]|uniref:Phage tail tape measure protein, TP901 family, core region n=1 Tax=Edaphosphingomonas laterariae TaxID=861865 RepID=A0A239CKJ1_9SPHN|nr:phage tail tape measure protein [Sphingomonas laterariae]SNS20695.1 phage tail tape measure protein, TP901 family, core region [Sphingomonas laterariae]